jgi:membrane complex biogenesis BtpA family protein
MPSATSRREHRGQAPGPRWPLPAKALVGMVHVGALPGTPGARQTVRELSRQAAAEARLLAKAGFDAVMIENMHDAPYVCGPHGPEIVSAITSVALEVQAALDPLRGRGRAIPLGVQILALGNREALAVALTAGGSFIRAENFVFAHIADEGLMPRAEAGELLRYRRMIGAESVAILADIKKKHASHALTADVPLADAAQAAGFFGADGLVVTGSATGRPTDPAHLVEARQATRDAGDALPVVVGSGVTPSNAAALLKHADTLIAGSWYKRDGHWRNPPDPRRAAALAQAVHRARR